MSGTSACCISSCAASQKKIINGLLHQRKWWSRESNGHDFCAFSASFRFWFWCHSLLKLIGCTPIASWFWQIFSAILIFFLICCYSGILLLLHSISIFDNLVVWNNWFRCHNCSQFSLIDWFLTFLTAVNSFPQTNIQSIVFIEQIISW